MDFEYIFLSLNNYGLRFIRKKVERVIRFNGFLLKNCGNDEQKQTVKNVILGLDPVCDS
jgi:hypothetical protein